MTQETSTISHEQIYDRLCTVEGKVDRIDKNTKDIVEAFAAVQGAFVVLGWIAKVAKPILWIASVLAAISLIWDNFRGK
jgi:hypothetical protein